MSKSDNTTGNIAIGLGVVLLGFVVYRTMSGSTGTPATPATTPANSTSPASASIGKLMSSLLSSTGTSGSALAGSLNSLFTTTGDTTGTVDLDQTYSSTAYNPDAISSSIAQDTTASMAASGESDIDSYGFTL
jgi:hypothetical protein